MPQKDKSVTCPCGRGQYRLCCAPFHRGEKAAPTAEALMRSRYSAYALGFSDYVLATWHSSTRPASLDLSTDLSGGKWLGLDVRQHTVSGDRAEVEFVARYKAASSPASRLHENSRFVCENGVWFYVDGDLFEG